MENFDYFSLTMNSRLMKVAEIDNNVAAACVCKSLDFDAKTMFTLYNNAYNCYNAPAFNCADFETVAIIYHLSKSGRSAYITLNDKYGMPIKTKKGTIRIKLNKHFNFLDELINYIGSFYNFNIIYHMFFYMA